MTRETPPSLTTLILLTAASVLALNMFLPSLAAIAEAYQAPASLVGLSISGYLIVTGALQLTLGPLSDRIGRRPVALGAVATFAAASAGAALASDIWTFLICRMVQGAMIAGYLVALAAIRDVAEEREATRRIGFVGMAMAAAPMLAPMLGGVIEATLGWRANFALYTVLGVGLFALTFFDFGETRRPAAPGAAKGATGAFGALLRTPRFLAPALCLAASRGGFYAFIAGAPVVAAAAYGLGPAEIGVAIGSITLGFMAGGFAATRLAPHVAPEAMMLAGRVVATIGPLAGVAAAAAGAGAAGALPLSGFIAAAMAVGVGNGLTAPASYALSMSADPDRAGAAAGLSGALTVALGAGVTAAVGALGADAARLMLTLTALSVAGLVAAIWSLRLRAGRLRAERL